MAQVVAGAAITLFVVQIWHELGHVLVAHLLRVPVLRIAVGFGPTLWRCNLTNKTQLVLRAIPAGMSVGVRARRSSNGHLCRPIMHDLCIAAGGPLASFVLSASLIAAAIWLPQGSFGYSWCLTTALLSGVIALVNLAPIPGLDGGHLMILVTALLGWQLPPQQEIRVHRLGIRVMVVILTVVPGLYSVWQWFTV